MDTKSFTNPSGRLVQVERDAPNAAYVAFTPGSLPPEAEDRAIAAAAHELGGASYALGQLTGIGQFFPNPDLLVRPYLRREAVSSSRIEGTVASFSDVVALEAGVRPPEGSDSRDVLNYVQALDTGLRRIQEGIFSLDLVRDLHRQLMTGARGENFSNPGEFRSIQNHIGTSRDLAEAIFVPPSPLEMHPVLDQLIRYLNEPKARTPSLVEAAWMHYQFEATHPFLDGNGRVGRLLIALLLAAREQVAHPLLYLSPYFERHRDEYTQLLFEVSATSAWEEWLRFFLRGVVEQADEAIDTAQRILALSDEWQRRLRDAGAAPSALRLAEFVIEHVAVMPRVVELGLGVARQTAYTSLQALAEVGILERVPLRQRGSLYIAPEMVDILEA